MLKPSNKPQVRVLIVDNEKRVVKLHEQLLSLWGYFPVVAEGVGASLLDDAKSKAEEHRCQIALVDMRLIDDLDEEDVSGLNLVKVIKPAETIIVSGYGTLMLALRSVLESGAVDFFEKGADPARFKEKIDKVARENCASCKNMSIEPVEILKDIEGKLFSPGVEDKYYDQVSDILVRLFPNAKKLRLDKINSSSAGFKYPTVPRPRSVILRVYEDDLQPVIVKIARSEKINKEVERYTQHIKGRLVGRYIPVLEDYIVLWDIGGIKLSYVGSIDETFANFVARNSVDKIEHSLKHLFLETWSQHYREAVEKSDVSLFSQYCEVWGIKWVERTRNTTMPTPIGEMPPALWEKVRSNNPLELFETMVRYEGEQGDPSIFDKTRLAITHGDLHADNLLIDNSQHGWVVDFERSGWGHALQDFIELEADTIIRLISTIEDFPHFYNFCIAIASMTSIQEIPQTSLFDNADDEIKKVLSVISIIRKLAVQCTKITDARQYLFGLYFNTIFRTTLQDGGVRYEYDKGELRTWMLASILSHRLVSGNNIGSWPPKEWQL